MMPRPKVVLPIVVIGVAALVAVALVIDARGRVVDTVDARPLPFNRSLSAVLSLPSANGSTPCVIRNDTTVDSSGVPFRATETQAVGWEELPVAPSIEAATTVRARCERPGEPMRCVVEIAAGGPADELSAKAFLQTLIDQPPVVEVTTPGGRSFNTALPGRMK